MLSLVERRPLVNSRPSGQLHVCFSCNPVWTVALAPDRRVRERRSIARRRNGESNEKIPLRQSTRHDSWAIGGQVRIGGTSFAFSLASR